MSLQKTYDDLKKGFTGVEKGDKLTTVDHALIGTSELIGNGLKFLPSAVEFGVAGLAVLAPEIAVPAEASEEVVALISGLNKAKKGAALSGLILGADELKTELKNNENMRDREMGRHTSNLPSGTKNQNQSSRLDPAHQLHRETKSIADRAVPGTGSLGNSSVLPPNESKTVPVIRPRQTFIQPPTIVNPTTSQRLEPIATGQPKNINFGPFN